MSFSLFARKAFLCGYIAAGLPALLSAAPGFVPAGGEFNVGGALPGEQVRPQLSLGPTGGFLVWEDNVTDGAGLGISALQLDNGYSAYLSPFRVNVTAAGDQEKPRVSLLKGGGAVFVWQGGRQGYQHIFARFRTAAGTWTSGYDVPVNSFPGNFQANPAVATLANSNVVVVWGSFNQASSTSLQDVYGQLFTPTGQRVGSEFLINQFTPYNQRTPVVAALANGGFVVAWVSEQERVAVPDQADPNYAYSATNQPSVDVYARIFDNNAVPRGNEFPVNPDLNLCANPALAAASDGSFMVAWSRRDLTVRTNGWDIFIRPFSSTGAGGSTVCANTTRYGDQFAPAISAAGTDYFVVWNSLQQDGSMEGVFGRFARSDASFYGGEVAVNTTWINKQIHPAVGSDGTNRFLVAWSSFVGLPYSMDLYSQRYLRVGTALSAMNAPFVYAPFVVSAGTYQPQLQVSWPIQEGIAVDHYDVYVDGNAVAAVTTNLWLMTAAQGLTANSTHTFQVDFVTTDGRRSPLSAPTAGRTWMGYSWYGSIPFEWMSTYFGYDTSTWPSPTDPVVTGGPSVLQVFLTGANPLLPATWLRVSLTSTAQGYFLHWNPQPGMIYQVQTMPSLGAGWTNFGGARFAAGTQDSVYIGLSNFGYYRVLRLR